MSLFTTRPFFFYFPNDKTSAQYQINTIQYQKIFDLEKFSIDWPEDMNGTGRKKPLVWKIEKDTDTFLNADSCLSYDMFTLFVCSVYLTESETKILELIN